MTRRIIAAAALAAALGAAAQSWPEVTPEMRPGTRWWWLGSAVDSLNLTRSLGQYAGAGLGSVEITPIYGVQGNEQADISYLSPRWMGMLGHVEDVAAANSMLVDMNQGTGWPFGGPEVTTDYSACKVLFLVDTVGANMMPVKTLPDKETPFAKEIASSRRTLPDGRQEVIRAFESRTRQMVKRAAPGGEGYVIDHLDRDAVGRYLAKFDRAFSETHTPYPHSFFNDSYEVYGANWTPRLLDEFATRRGYRLEDHLPELLGIIDDGGDVLCDYRETVGDLLLENFTEQWAGWSRERGVKVRNQAHGSPANLIDVYAAVDVPEIEGFGLSDFGIAGLRADSGFTRKNDSDVSMLKYASSAAHITGKPLTSSETFTWLTEHFRTSLSQMKPDFDLMMTCGVNNVFFHGTTYSPADDPWPGWRFYASVDMSPANTIWRDVPAMTAYMTRCQSMLQQGRSDNDFLIYLPVRDMWHRRLAPMEKGLMMAFSIHEMGRYAPDFIGSVMQIDSLGYDCDYISDRYLLSSVCRDSKIVTAAGTPYKALIIPGSGRLTPALKAHLDSLVSQGATIIRGIDTTAMRRAAMPEPMRASTGLRAIRRAAPDGGHIYFMANLSPRDIDTTVPLATAFTDAAWFDPMTGAIYRADHSGGRVAICLRSGESRILRTYPATQPSLTTRPAMRRTESYDLGNRPWTLTFAESMPAESRTFRLDSLMPWTALADTTLNELAGTGIYRTTVDVADASSADSWEIDLGDVRESARLYVNGTYVATAWAAPFTLRFDGLIRTGANEIRIEVTNLPANRIAALDRRGVKWRKFKEINVVDINYRPTGYAHWATVASGLNSAVTLHRLRSAR